MNKIYRCGKFHKRVCLRASLGDCNFDCNDCRYYKTTIKQYFSYGGTWNVHCDMSTPYRSMTVTVGFINSNNDADETQFDINAYNINELSNLFKAFCAENNFPNNTVQYVNVVDIMEERR